MLINYYYQLQQLVYIYYLRSTDCTLDTYLTAQTNTRTPNFKSVKKFFYYVKTLLFWSVQIADIIVVQWENHHVIKNTFKRHRHEANYGEINRDIVVE